MAVAAAKSDAYDLEDRWPDCGQCDREVVKGVACDGQREKCPARQMMLRHLYGGPTRSQLYLGEVRELAISGEFDAVRSES